MRILLLVIAAALASAAPRAEKIYRTTPQGELKMHLFYPEGWKPSDRRPAIVLFFGGGFVGGTPQQFFTKARYLASRGMVAASAEYRVASRHKTTPDESFEDCRAAVAWMKSSAAEHGIDPARVAAGGGSAGATCAMKAAFDGSDAERPAALVLFNPAAELARAGSVWHAVDEVRDGRTLPPTVMFFGTADKLLDAARAFQEKAERMKQPVQLYLAKGQAHGFFNEREDHAEWHQSTTYLADRFLSTLGYTAGHPTMAFTAGSRAALATARPAAPVGGPAREIAGARLIGGVQYLNNKNPRQQLDLYLPETPAKTASGRTPLVVWVHGGAWLGGNKLNPPAAFLLKKGFAVASIHYRLSTEAVFPAQLEDCQAALAWLRANASTHSLDADRIGVWGASAGGHLVALLGLTANVQAVVDYYGPAHLARMGEGPSSMDHDGPDSPESLLIGGPIQANQDKAWKASPISYAGKGPSAPFFIVHGDADPLVIVEQSELFHAALRKSNIESALRIIPGAGHGGPQFQTPEMLDAVEAFFRRHLVR